jgi:predicted urease superfamily metal-dependent hydrolase
MRLVPNQEWEHITELFKHFMSIAHSVTVKVPHHGGHQCSLHYTSFKAANMAGDFEFHSPVS